MCDFYASIRQEKVCYGRSKEELIGKNDYDFFPENEADFFTAKDNEVLSQASIVDSPKNLLLQKVGKYGGCILKKFQFLTQPESLYTCSVSLNT